MPVIPCDTPHWQSAKDSRVHRFAGIVGISIALYVVFFGCLVHGSCSRAPLRSRTPTAGPAMAHRLLQDPEADGWERNDFPIVCETCLGPNPYVRMQRVRGMSHGEVCASRAASGHCAGCASGTTMPPTRASPLFPAPLPPRQIEYGGTCHISGRPYTVFRWRPGNDARYKKTIICQEVAKAKNVCQVCLLDLDYNLPVQVRDQALGMADDALPESTAGREYALQQMADNGELDRSKFDAPAPPDLLLRLQRTTPYYKVSLGCGPLCALVAGEDARGGGRGRGGARGGKGAAAPVVRGATPACR